ncbi:PR-1-like protein [Mycena floridula]|nr:PR-1-like protein [Mycena floridula]
MVPQRFFNVALLSFLGCVVGLAMPVSRSSETSADDIAAYLQSHNDARAQHGANPLSWSDDLASKAQSWADRCVFEHSGGSLGPFGENLAAGTGSFGIADAIQIWVDEAKDYNPAAPVASHFTQVVWKSTTQVGCAVQSCNGIFDPVFGPANFFVCEYNPAGNVIGEFSENVQV